MRGRGDNAGDEAVSLSVMSESSVERGVSMSGAEVRLEVRVDEAERDRFRPRGTMVVVVVVVVVEESEGVTISAS